ncbi:MAG: penicillin-binding protein 2 [Neomegalonema sp.]|nr:penicillin-binding protein 2 [Neomegalonema sp.]
MFDDRRERDRRATFTRRAIVLFGAQLGVAGVLGVRLYKLQIVDQAQYRKLAEDNRINPETIAPERGEIFDRAGAPLAVNRPNYTLSFIREQAKDLEKAIADLRALASLSDREVQSLRRKLKRSAKFKPVLVKEDLDWDTFARLNANAPALPGALLDVGLVRTYPEADKLAHVIGYVGAVTSRDLKRHKGDDRLLRLPGARIGKTGVELAAEKTLRGEAGVRRVEINAGGREVAEIDRIEGDPGSDLTLTIDLALQRYAMKRIEKESAAVVVMDCITGDLLVLASGPAYDPNKFVFGISQRDWDDLRRDEYDPLRNKALAGEYPPGSTFKMITAIAALEAGKISPRTSFTCTGRMKFGDRYFHCWKRAGHGRVDMLRGVKNSCDVYFYEAALSAGIDKIAEVARKFGVGEAPKLEIPNVRDGLLPTRDWVRKTYKRGWNGGETLNVGIGQGALLMTPLQMAVMTARIANGAEQVQARIVKAINGVELERAPFEPLDVSKDAIDIVKAGMFAVSNEPGGTAFRSRIADPENALAGKTGTAQVRRIGKEERAAGVKKNADLPWRLRDHALFVAFAPVKTPRYAISVIVEHGGGGSKAAAPVARDVLMRALYGPQPPLEAYPVHLRREIAKAREEAEKAKATGADPVKIMGE